MILSDRSRARLATCHPDLVRVVERASLRFPLVVLCGFRGEKDQNDAFKRGASKLRWPESKHNQTPSLAVDLAPDPIEWENTKAFIALGGVVLECAKAEGVWIDWGGNWKRFRDFPHYELARPKK